MLGVAAGASLAGALAAPPRRAARPARSIAALLSVAPALFALRGGELAAYHGVEHKAIAAYEQTTPTTRATPPRSTSAAARTSSRRCSPSNLAGTLLLRRVARAARARWRAARVALASTAVAVEVFAWCERNAATPLAQALRRPGFEIQRLIGTREPDERQLEVGRAALAEILRVEAAYI